MRSKALVIAYAVHETGRREVIGIDIGEVESEAFWVEFLRGLVRQGPGGRAPGDLRRAPGSEGGDRAGPRLPLAALHRALRAQHARPLPPRRARPGLRRPARDLRRARRRERPASASARCWSASAPSVPKVAELLEEAEEDLLAFYRFPQAHWPKLRSTNPLERVNREIGRRSDVVGIFPNDASAIRLAGALLDRAERRVARCPPLPLGGVDRPGPRGPGR